MLLITGGPLSSTATAEQVAAARAAAGQDQLIPIRR